MALQGMMYMYKLDIEKLLKVLEYLILISIGIIYNFKMIILTFVFCRVTADLPTYGLKIERNKYKNLLIQILLMLLLKTI